MTDVIRSAAAALARAAETRTAIAPLKPQLEPLGIDGAYAVQNLLTERALGAGRKLAGRKIGLTSKAVQTQLGVDQPDYGMLFADMEIGEHEEIALGRFIQPKVEAEIAFVLGRDLSDPELTLSRLVQAIDFALPAVEIVDSRIADWKISILDTIADNASSGAYVLGGSPVKIDTIDLRLCGMVLEHKGEPVSVGCGAACLGNPLAAALWLARTMATAGRPLVAGDVILSGALGPMVSVTPGGAYQARINGVGSVNLRFAKEAAR
ncbi:2-keto-4-pentenoate hydratase [Sphingoaurantiacus capsulatus]|uniref:2-keto-4-pentenoate hydratase n=1 Tax=Sphingoaurantiacus capsulatus TaxID=1771310 RepID=A0ABV7XC09_9SPHN